MRRPGFVASPRLVFPALIVVVVTMFHIFDSFGNQDVSTARILATTIVGAVILILFAVLAIAARRSRVAVREK